MNTLEVAIAPPEIVNLEQQIPKKLLVRGIEVFGSQKKFERWMNTVSIALGGVTPRKLARTPAGIERILDELIRIEQFVIA